MLSRLVEPNLTTSAPPPDSDIPYFDNSSANTSPSSSFTSQPSALPASTRSFSTALLTISARTFLSSSRPAASLSVVTSMYHMPSTPSLFTSAVTPASLRRRAASSTRPRSVDRNVSKMSFRRYTLYLTATPPPDMIKSAAPPLLVGLSLSQLTPSPLAPSLTTSTSLWLITFSSPSSRGDP